MSKTFGLLIGTRRYEVKEVDDGFASYLENAMNEDFNLGGNNEITTLLQAYVRKNYEIYKQDEVIKQLYKKLDEEV